MVVRANAQGEDVRLCPLYLRHFVSPGRAGPRVRIAAARGVPHVGGRRTSSSGRPRSY